MMPSSTIVIIPTYNEAKNITPLVAEVFQYLPKTKIMIVDDNSPDGTGEIADQLAQQYDSQIFVFHRTKKEGLGRAYQFAFEEALNMGIEQIIQMDADFSHPPQVLPLFLEKLKDYDFVLGSRYVSGGRTKNWSHTRRILSHLGNYYARFILGLPTKDLTGGFKAFNRPVIEYLMKQPLDSLGYSFQIETTAKALAKGFCCCEVPFTFTERATGKSKISYSIIGEALIKTFQLKKSLVVKPKLTKELPEDLSQEEVSISQALQTVQD